MKPQLTIEAFADWCEKQPADEAYDFYAKDCAWGQFLTSLGVEYACVGFNTWTGSDGQRRCFPSGIAFPVEEEPHTFGALASRLRSVQP